MSGNHERHAMRCCRESQNPWPQRSRIREVCKHSNRGAMGGIGRGGEPPARHHIRALAELGDANRVSRLRCACRLTVLPNERIECGVVHIMSLFVYEYRSSG